MSKKETPIALGSWVMFNNKYYVIWAINTRQHINNPTEIKYTYDIYNEETNDYIIGISGNNFITGESTKQD